MIASACCCKALQTVVIVRFHACMNEKVNYCKFVLRLWCKLWFRG